MWKSKLKVANIPSMKTNLKKIPTKKDEEDECCEQLRRRLVELNHNKALSTEVDFDTIPCDNLVHWAEIAADWARKYLRGDLNFDFVGHEIGNTAAYDLMVDLLDAWSAYYHCSQSKGFTNWKV